MTQPVSLSEAQMAALKAAASRPRGNVCPIFSVRGTAEKFVLNALTERGLIDWDGNIPLINDAGRAVVAEART